MSATTAPGWVLAVAPDGSLEPIRATDPIAAEFSRPLAVAVERCVDTLGESLVSVYVRGSVARGTAVVGTSDCDVVAIVDEPVRTGVDPSLLDRPAVVDGVRLDITVTPLADIGVDGRRRQIGGLLSLEGRCVHGRPVETAPPILDVTIDPVARLDEVVHRVATRRERWPSGRFAWRLLRAGAQCSAAVTYRFPLDLVPTVQQLEAVGGPWNNDRLTEFAEAVRADDMRPCSATMLDLAVELVADHRSSASHPRFTMIHDDDQEDRP